LSSVSIYDVLVFVWVYVHFLNFNTGMFRQKKKLQQFHRNIEDPKKKGGEKVAP
jgi:hypothetical protein